MREGCLATEKDRRSAVIAVAVIRNIRLFEFWFAGENPPIAVLLSSRLHAHGAAEGRAEGGMLFDVCAVGLRWSLSCLLILEGKTCCITLAKTIPPILNLYSDRGGFQNQPT